MGTNKRQKRALELQQDILLKKINDFTESRVGSYHFFELVVMGLAVRETDPAKFHLIKI
jgi:hypothetical protein